MHALNSKHGTPALAVTGVTVMSGFMATLETHIEGFTDDSTLTGDIYYWQRERDREDVTDSGEYKTNLFHSTWSANLDFRSGYATDMSGLNIAASTMIEVVKDGNSSHPDEIAFSKSNKAYDEDWSDDKGGVSLYKAAAKFEYGPAWAKVGYTQSTGQMLLAPHWSFIPGTYWGAEAGANFDYGDAGALSFPYTWINRYKAPWHPGMNEFYQSDKAIRAGYLRSIGARYDFKNSFILEVAFGQVGGYIDQYLIKASYESDIAGNPLITSYQFYGTRDKVDDRSVNDLHDSTAWLQALTFDYWVADVVGSRLEGTWVKTDGRQRYFL